MQSLKRAYVQEITFIGVMFPRQYLRETYAFTDVYETEGFTTNPDK